MTIALPLSLFLFIVAPWMALLPRSFYIWPVLAAASLLPLLYQHRKEIKMEVCARTLLLFGGATIYTCLSVFWSPSPRAAEMAIGLGGIGICGLILFLVIPFIPDATREKGLTTFAAGFGVGIALLAVEFFFDHPLHRMFEHLPKSQPVNENVIKRMVALFALAIWPFALILEKRGQRKYAALCVIAFFVLSGFMTSRSALLGMMIGCVIMFFSYHQAALARWVLMLVIGFGVIFTPPLFLILPLAPHEITGKFFDSAQARMKIWALTAQHVVEAPIFGNGLDASRGIESTVSDKMAEFVPEGTSIISQHPHNIFLQLWLDLGLLGALAWGGLMLIMVDRTRFLPEAAQPYVLAALYCSVTMLSTTFSMLQTWWAGGHLAVATVLFMLCYSISRKSGISGTSAGGIA